MNKFPCSICLDEKCNGLYNCDCNNCSKKKECYRKLVPTIRITTKCTQSCSHCCFECSPLKNDFMTIENSKLIKRFLTNNNILDINLMGGEFSCNPEWKEILSILIPNLETIRLVTNGDFDESIIIELSKYKNLYLAISYDKWHNNKNFEKACELAKKYNIKYQSGFDMLHEDGIIPVGRSEFSSNVYSFFSCYCFNPQKQYYFLIDEQGDIFKCGFGAWKYANVDEYLDGEFDKRFKEFNKKFYSLFISNCRRCMLSYKVNK